MLSFVSSITGIVAGSRGVEHEAGLGLWLGLFEDATIEAPALVLLAVLELMFLVGDALPAPPLLLAAAAHTAADEQGSRRLLLLMSKKLVSSVSMYGDRDGSRPSSTG
jgi:hypothetical protein